MTARHTFRAIWPITDQTIPFAELCRQATWDIAALATQAHAELAGPGQFTTAPAARVPGSGRTTPTVLVYAAPARPAARRSYWKAAS